jgi:hypothetical protein
VIIGSNTKCDSRFNDSEHEAAADWISPAAWTDRGEKRISVMAVTSPMADML